MSRKWISFPLREVIVRGRRIATCRRITDCP